jgi:hypothetical protein
METNEIIAWLFIILNILVYLLKDTNVLCKEIWKILKCFWIALGIVLAIGFVKAKLKD